MSWWPRSKAALAGWWARLRGQSMISDVSWCASPRGSGSDSPSARACSTSRSRSVSRSIVAWTARSCSPCRWLTRQLDALAQLQERLPRVQAADGRHDLAGRTRLVEHTGRSGLHRALHRRGAVITREHQGDGLGGAGAQFVEQANAVPVRQMQVDEGDVGQGQQRAALPDRAGLADDGDVRLPLQHEGQRLPEREVVVDQHHPDRRANRLLFRHYDLPHPLATCPSAPVALAVLRHKPVSSKCLAPVSWWDGPNRPISGPQGI